MMGMLTIMLGPLLCIWLAHCLHVFKYAACTYGDHCSFLLVSPHWNYMYVPAGVCNVIGFVDSMQRS
jgi:hypothetical protein